MIQKIQWKYFFIIFSFITVPALAQFKVVGYLPTWLSPATAIASVDLDKLTHVNIAFANPNASGVLVVSDGVSGTQVNTVVSTCHTAGVKVFLSIGGAGANANRYKMLLSTAVNQTNFVNNILSYATAHNLDGIDVDIEGDVLDGSHVTQAQYQSFVTELADSLHAHNKLMSAALATWFADYVSNTAAAQFDWINIMSYDEYGPWSGAGAHSPYTLATEDFEYWNTTKNVSASKLTVGVPFYGYGWGTYQSEDEITYCDIVNTYAGAEDNDQIGSGSNRISYNGQPTIRNKTDFALESASGIMIWQIVSDCPTSDSRSLLLAIHEQILAAQLTTAVWQTKQAQQAFSLYPNPAQDQVQFSFQLSQSTQATLLLCGINGQTLNVIKQGTFHPDEQQWIDVKAYPAGMYVLKLLTDQGTSVQKLVKQ